ncbi:MAG: hypothetical protein PHD73_05900 [Sediminibacterium sp.]|nr:hypothetical protein [Sediminibacterium sp.]
MISKLILVVGSAVCVCASAQNRNDLLLRPNHPDTVYLPQRNQPEIPNALGSKDPAYKIQLKGNNGAGFDLYESPLDHMPVLVPDKSNTSRMPVVISTPAPGNMMRNYSRELKPLPDTIPPAAPFNYKKFIPKKESGKEKKTLF